MENVRMLEYRTTISMFAVNEEKERVQVMFFGRPALYWISFSRREAVETLKRAWESKRMIRAELDPFTLEIFNVSPVEAE